MACRQIDLDDESDRILSGLAQDYQGDLGKALGHLLRAHESVESFVAACEEDQRDTLLVQRERAERGFREGRFTAWDEIKRRNNL
jgi:thymidine kinase